jgi:hypothetical protein
MLPAGAEGNVNGEIAVHSRREILFGAVAAGVVVMAGPALAAEEVVLGSRTVNLGSDHDHIRVGLLKGIFSHIRLEVEDNGIFMQDLRVTFMNGETANLRVRAFIEEGGRTRDILLPGILRAIRHIDMTYRRVPLGGRARVTIVGRRQI